MRVDANSRVINPHLSLPFLLLTSISHLRGSWDIDMYMSSRISCGGIQFHYISPDTFQSHLDAPISCETACLGKFIPLSTTWLSCRLRMYVSCTSMCKGFEPNSGFHTGLSSFAYEHCSRIEQLWYHRIPPVLESGISYPYLVPSPAKTRTALVVLPDIRLYANPILVRLLALSFTSSIDQCVCGIGILCFWIIWLFSYNGSLASRWDHFVHSCIPRILFHLPPPRCDP